jgi:hypothetical protein
MVSHMKTTIDISDSLMRRCKTAAAARRVTMRSLIEEGLHAVLDERERRAPFKLRTVRFNGGGFQPGFEETGWDRIRDAVYEGRGA